MTTATPIIRSSTGAEFLSMVPALAGYTATDSVLVVPFEGKRTIGRVMRLDLPGPRPREVHDALASLLLGNLSRLDRVDGLVLVVYAPGPFPNARAAHDRLRRTLERRLRDGGFRIVDSFLVADDGWASWQERRGPWAGHPLEQIESGEVKDRADAVRGALRPIRAQAELPRPEPELLGALDEAALGLLEFEAEVDAFGRVVPAAPYERSGFAEQLLAQEAEALTLRQLARLAVLAAVPRERDETLLQIAFGVDAGRRAERSNDEIHEERERTGESLDEIVLRWRAEGRHGDHGLDDMMLGETRRRPDPDRLQRAIDALGRVAANAGPPLQPGVRCMLGWLHWALGEGTAAGNHLDESLRIDPGHGMTQVLRALVGSGKVPEWAFVRE